MSIDLVSGTIVSVAVPVIPDVLTEPPELTTMAVVPVEGPPGPPGDPGLGITSGTFSVPVVVNGEIVVEIRSGWGVTADGEIYYDTDGAVPSEAAIASLDLDGAFVLIRPED